MEAGLLCNRRHGTTNLVDRVSKPSDVGWFGCLRSVDAINQIFHDDEFVFKQRLVALRLRGTFLNAFLLGRCEFTAFFLNHKPANANDRTKSNAKPSKQANQLTFFPFSGGRLDGFFCAGSRRRTLDLCGS